MSDKKIIELKKKLEKRIRDCWHGKEIGTSCGCNRIKCSELNCKAYPWLHTITSHFYKSHPDLTPKFRLQSGFAPFAFTCRSCQKSFEEGEDKGPYHFYWNSGRLEPNEVFCETCATKFKELRKNNLEIKRDNSQKSRKQELNMSKLKEVKTKKIKKKISLPKASVKTTKTKSLKPRSVRSKENTLAYFDCLREQVANPLNEKVKITSMCHQCKYDKGKVAVAKQEEKQQLVNKVAGDYLAFGQSLGSLLHANITCGCKK